MPHSQVPELSALGVGLSVPEIIKTLKFMACPWAVIFHRFWRLCSGILSIVKRKHWAADL